MSQPRLLLADDHKETAELLAACSSGFEVIAKVQTALPWSRPPDSCRGRNRQDDFSMPGLDGLAAAAQILRRSPSARFVFVTVHCDPLMVQRGFENRRARIR